MKETTLCYISRDDCWLMLHRVRKENDNSAGKWIGVGGKIEPGETPEECILREVMEETGLKMTRYEKRARIEFYSDIYEDEIMHVYTCTEFSRTGSPIEDEGDLVWVPIKQVPELNLWEGDRIFLRKIAEGEPYFEMKLTYRGDDLAAVEYM